MRRKGFQLIEILIALSILAGPILIVIGLMHANSRAVGAMQEREERRALATEALELVLAATRDELPRLCGKDGSPVLAEAVKEALSARPPAFRTLALEAAAPHFDKLVCDYRPIPGAPGLATVRVSFGDDTPSGIATSRMVRIDRPATF